MAGGSGESPSQIVNNKTQLGIEGIQIAKKNNLVSKQLPLFFIWSMQTD